MGRLSSLFGVAAIVAMAAGCAGADAAADGTDESLEPIVRASTHVVEAKPGEDVNVEADRLVFRAAGHEDLLARSAGDVLACGAGGGFLRRVLGVRTEGDTIVVDTAQASLEDAIEQGRLRQHVLADEAGGLAPHSLGGGKVKLAVPPTHIPLGATGSIDVDQGELDYTPDFDLDLLVRRGSIERMRVVAGGSASASMRVRFDLHKQGREPSGTTFSLGREEGVEVASVPAVHAIVWVGVVPVVVSIKMQLLLGYELELAGDAQGELDLDLAAALSAGLARQNGAWQTIGSSTFNAAPHGTVRSPTNTVEGDVTLTARVAVSFYELAGPYVGIQTYAGVGRDRRPSGDEWFGRVGIRGVAGVEAGLFGKATIGYRVDAFDRSVKVALTSP